MNDEYSSFKGQSKGGQPGDWQVFVANSKHLMNIYESMLDYYHRLLPEPQLNMFY
jgi:hypothetical protein